MFFVIVEKNCTINCQFAFSRCLFEFANRTDEFTIESASLGKLQRLRIGHDNSGPSPGWFLDKVIVDDVTSNRVYEFPCQRWLAKDEDDGQISRDLVCGRGGDGGGMICNVLNSTIPIK